MDVMMENIDLNNCIVIQTGDISLNDVNYKKKEDSVIIPNDESKNAAFQCKFCNEIFSKWITFKKHEAHHKNEKKFKCDRCTASFNISSNLNLHKAIHNEIELKCPECRKFFARVASLRAHLILHEKDESVSCIECEMSFDTELQLESHLKVHEKKRKSAQDTLKCKMCNRDFVDATEHKLHMHNHNKLKHLFGFSHRNSTNKNRKIRVKYVHMCNICPKSFQKRSQLIRHLRVHSGERPFKCTLCNQAFSQNNTLKIHMSKHTGVRPFKCLLCPGTFSQKGNLRVHIHRVHSMTVEENAFHCTECACAFRRLSALNAHINRVHGDAPAIYSPLKPDTPNVVVANGEFSTNVHRHPFVNSSETRTPNNFKYITLADTNVGGVIQRYYIGQRKVDGVRWLQCTHCTKEFKKPSDVVRHIRTHTREKPFQCPTCGRGFAVKSTLTTHLRTHTNEKVHTCAICEKSFSASSSLQAHIRRHTGIKKSYRCDTCPNAYETPEQLKIHSMIHKREQQKKENIEPEKPPIQLKDPILITDRENKLQCTPAKSKLVKNSRALRNHQCQTCGSSFRRSGHLKQHIKMHSNDRPFSCPKCSRAFKSTTVLNSHIRTHDGIKKYHCSECSGAFTTNGSLRRHMTRHSHQRPYMCPYCKKTFKTYQNCRKHIKSHCSDVNLDVLEEKTKMQASGGGPLISVLKSTNVHLGEISILDNILTDKNVQTDPMTNVTSYESVISDQELISNNSQNQIICQLLTTDNVISPTAAVNISQQQNIFEIDNALNQELLNLLNREGKFPNMAVTKELLTALEQGTDLQLRRQSCESQQITFVLNYDNKEVNDFKIIDQSTLDPTLVKNNDCDLGEANIVTGNDIITKSSDETQNVPDLLETQEQKSLNAEDSMDDEYRHIGSLRVKRFMCSVCGKNFGKPSDLERHVRTHTGERPFRCEKCGKSFSLKSTLKSHMKVHSSVVKKFACPECDCLFSTKGSLKVHIRIHTGSKPFQCPCCPMRFRTSGHRRAHCRIHSKETERRNESNNSTKKIKTVENNGEIVIPEPPISEEKVESTRAEDNVDIYSALSDNRTLSAINLDVLNTFSETVLENKREHEASILEQLENGSLLVQDIAFDSSDHASWYDIETDETGQIVEIRPMSNTVTEIPTEIEISTLRPIEFIQNKEDDSVVIKDDHSGFISDGTDSSQKNKGQNICRYCEKSFDKPSKLERHLRIHTGDRPFVCKICKRAFTQTNSLNAHMRTHSGNKPFKCSYCNHSTAQKGNLNIHLLKIHGVSTTQGEVPKLVSSDETIQKQDFVE